ncbi:DEAD/DEAH box helicase [Aerococcus urinae]|uniref:DEAD/DEAH box helicase n=1 Tax=Aerococcus urinae TaxID=1376 RepID=UPI00254D0BD8|nr:DEAD/DEAH box helicase [Aerococcus urinae]
MDRSKLKLEETLHDYQKYCVDWALQKEKVGLFLDMGLGKTLATLATLDYLVRFGLIGKTLVVAPLSVAEGTWGQEIDQWPFLCLTYTKLTGDKDERIQALQEDKDIYIINYDKLLWLYEYCGKRWPFDTVVFDELSAFKSSKTKRFKATRKMSPKFKRVIGLTGTPSPNSLHDLWPQLYILDQGERLEKTVTKYRKKYFTPRGMFGVKYGQYDLVPGAEKEIYDKIGDICISMKKEDYLDMPERVNNTLEVELKPKERKLYKQLERDYVLSLDDSEIEAGNAAVLSNKLLQMASGAVYDDDGKVVEIHKAKLDRLQEVIDEAQGQPVLVFYSYKHDLERIRARFPQAKLFNAKDGDIEAWNRGEIPILLAHPQSAGHGLNLQKGGHIIVWFSLIWSLEYYQQANARLDRQGQKDSVIVHHLVTKDTVDEIALKRLKDKDATQEDLLQALKAKIEEAKSGQ